MGRNILSKGAVLAFFTSSLISTTALAGGFDRGGVNIDQLFDNETSTADASVTFVTPQRSSRNIQRTINVAAPVVGALGGGVVAPLSTGEVEADGDFFVPRLGYKHSFTENVDCLFSYSEPFGADSNNGTGNALSASSVEFFIDTEDYGATCSVGFAGPETSLGESQFRIIGGVSYQEFDGFLSRQSFLDFAAAGIPTLADGGAVQAVVQGGAAAGGVPAPLATVTNTAGLGTFTVSGDAVGYRVGASFEIPAIALRAVAIYNSAYDYELSGVQDNTGFGVATTNANAVVPISLTTEIPQSVEVKLQTGIAEGTLAFANFKWQDWSRLQSIPIQGGVTATVAAAGGAVAVPTSLAFEPLYEDGYTVTGGIGRQLSENLSGLVSLTWDRGTATTTGGQTDTWTLAGGLSFKENERFEVRIGGGIGLSEAGISSGAGTTDPANAVIYEFGEDFVAAFSAGAKLRF